MAEASSTSSTAATPAPAGSIASSDTAPASWIAAGMTRSTALQIQAAKRRGRWVRAIDLLTPLLDSDCEAEPATPPPSEPAASLASASLSLSSADSELTDLLLQRAECAFLLDEYHAALSDCERVLQVKPKSISAASLRVKCWLGLRRYEEAEDELAKLGKIDVRSCTCHFAPLQQLWKRIQLERQGQYDMAALAEESFRLLTPSEPCDTRELLRSQMYPCVRLGPHADYLHPAVECAVEIAGKSRGTRVLASSASSSASSSSSPCCSNTSSSSSGLLLKHTLVMSMKAIAAHLHSDGLSTQKMLMRKLADQPNLVAQVKRLFGLASQESSRSQLLSEASAEEVWKQPAAAPSAATTASTLSSKESLVATLKRNPFCDWLGEGWHGVGGGGLFFLPSLFNHSCVPNCDWKMIGDQIFIRTLREVAAGEELTITYWPKLMDSFSKRQAELSAWWHFVCQCERCAMEQQHPELPAREEQLEAECAQLEGTFETLTRTQLPPLAAAQRITRTTTAANRTVELDKIATRLQLLIDSHKQLISATLASSSPLAASLAHISLLPQLQRLGNVLESILALLPSDHSYVPPLLQQCRRACMESAAIAERWDGCKYPAYQVGVFRLLAMQVRYPEHATLTPQKQALAMGAYIRQYMQSNGDASPAQLEMEHGEEIDRRGLRPLFDECCTAIAKEKSGSSS